MTIRKAILVLSLGMLLVSCAKPAIKPVTPPMAKPAEGAVTIETLRDSLFLKEITSIKSEVSVQASKNGETLGTFSGILAYKAPDAVNLRLFGPLSLTVADLVMNEKLLQVYIPLRNTLYEGEAPSLSEFKTRKDLLYAVEELKNGYVLYMLKESNPDDMPKSMEVELIGRYAFSNKTSPVNTGATLYRNKKQSLDISFEDFTGSLPLTLKVRAGSTELLMRLIEPEVNGEVSDEFFMPKDHEGKEVKPLKELSGKGL